MRSACALLYVLCTTARGVAVAHAAGWVHTDLKPENTMVAVDSATGRLVGKVSWQQGQLAVLACLFDCLAAPLHAALRPLPAWLTHHLLGATSCLPSPLPSTLLT